MPRSSVGGGIVGGVWGAGLFNVSLKCSAHRALWSPSLESRFPFLSSTGQLGLLFFPESVLVMSYSFFSYFFVPLQFLPLPSAPRWIFFYLFWHFSSQMCSGSKIVPAVLFSLQGPGFGWFFFTRFLSAINTHASVVSHSLCFFVFFPRTVLHVDFHTSCMWCHWSSISSSWSWESELNLFFGSTLNSFTFPFSFRQFTLNIWDGLLA